MELETRELWTSEELADYKDTFALGRIAWQCFLLWNLHMQMRGGGDKEKQAADSVSSLLHQNVPCRPDQLQLVSHRGLEPGFCF